MDPKAQLKVASNSRRQATFYLKKGKFGRAFSHFLVTLKLVPNWRAELKDVFSSTLCAWGKLLESSGRYSDLFNCYEQALEVFPDHEVLLSNLGGHLYRKLKKYHDTVITQLQAISSGLKPGFLWDVPVSVSGPQLVNLLASLMREGLVNDDVRVVSVAGDLLLLNVPLIRERMTKHLESGCAMSVYNFVDVSVSTPTVLSPSSEFYPKVCLLMSSLLSCLAFPEEEAVVTVPLEGDWCMNTVVGVLLGYPVVYWYDGIKPASLSMTPLTVFQFSAKRGARWCVVYDFSIPSSLAASLEVHIKNWYSQLLLTLSVFSQVQLTAKVVTLPHVMF